MILLLSITAGVLFSAGLYMVLRRSLVKILVGLLLLGYAVNLLLFSSATLTPGRPPILPSETSGVVADPVPQALILTAIVISFGITAFAVGLVRQVFHVLGTDDTNALYFTDLASDLPSKAEENHELAYVESEASVMPAEMGEPEHVP